MAAPQLRLPISIPICQKAVTPLCLKLDPSIDLSELFASLLDMPYPAFLDSALLSPRLGRFSYITADPFLVLRSKGNRLEVVSPDGTQKVDGNPFHLLQDVLKRFPLSPLPGLPPFQGGAVGYLSYELGHHLEKLPHHAVDDLSLPEMNLAFYDWLIARDHTTHDTWAIATGLPSGDKERARERLDWVQSKLRSTTHLSPVGSTPVAAGLESNFTHASYLQAVAAVKDYIVKGDVYQVNISQRFQASISCSSWELYLRLRQMNPAPFAAYLQYPEVAVLSASPEEFLHLKQGSVHTRPMKGTRPRGDGIEEDLKLAQELSESVKDRAENVMIVDLLRNDLGKVCIPGTVEVPELFVIEKYPTVFQMVSTVRGVLQNGLNAVDLLQACFPGGSVTGAPKIRAMEIINELESTQRSVYCGAIGYLGFDGSMLTCIPIRTLLVKRNMVYFQVGGGIVADSDPQAEYEETLHKAKGSFKALGIHG